MCGGKLQALARVEPTWRRAPDLRLEHHPRPRSAARCLPRLHASTLRAPSDCPASKREAAGVAAPPDASPNLRSEEAFLNAPSTLRPNNTATLLTSAPQLRVDVDDHDKRTRRVEDGWKHACVGAGIWHGDMDTRTLWRNRPLRCESVVAAQTSGVTLSRRARGHGTGSSRGLPARRSSPPCSATGRGDLGKGGGARGTSSPPRPRPPDKGAMFVNDSKPVFCEGWRGGTNPFAIADALQEKEWELPKQKQEKWDLRFAGSGEIHTSGAGGSRWGKD